MELFKKRNKKFISNAKKKIETGKDKKTFNLDAVCVIVFEPLVECFTVFTFSVCVTVSVLKHHTIKYKPI